MRVHMLHPADLGACELARWTAIRRACACYASPYFHPRFTQIVGQHRADARVLVVETDGETVGFWPLHRRPDGFARAIGQPFSDQNGPILLAHAPPLAEVLRAAGLWGAGFTAAPAAIGRLDPAVRGASDSAVISLGADGAATLERLRVANASHFKSLRRRERRAVEAFGTIHAKWGEARQDAMALLMAWKRAQFQRTGLFDVFAPRWARGVIDALFAERGPDFQGVLSTLRFGETPVAMEFGLLDGGHLHSWLAAYDHAYAPYSPGHLLLTSLIETGPARGVGAIELGVGADYYKKNYLTEAVSLRRGVVQAASLTSAVLGLQDRLWRAAEDSNIRGVSELFARARRRADNIVSAELTLAGRVRGVAHALRGRGPSPGPAAATAE